MLLALLLAAQPQVIGVLEFRDKVPVEQRIDAAYLSDQVRSAVKGLLPQAKVITRENMLVLLRSSGQDLAGCEGECEVDTGRRIGADLVVSGELLRFGTQYKLNMKLHDTRSGELISGAVASGALADDLDRDLRPAVSRLLSPLVPEPHQDRLSDPRSGAEAAAPREEKPRRQGVLIGIWGTLGYASTSASSALASSSGSAGGFAYGLGGHVFLPVLGALSLGALADYSFFSPVSGGRVGGLLGGGGLRIDLGQAALTAGGGYVDLSGGGGSGYGLLGALESGAFRLQLTWRHGSASSLSGITSVERTESVVSVQTGLQLNF